MGELKFSGNSLRVRRTHLLYHGTLLYDFSLGRDWSLPGRAAAAAGVSSAAAPRGLRDELAGRPRGVPAP